MDGHRGGIGGWGQGLQGLRGRLGERLGGLEHIGRRRLQHIVWGLLLQHRLLGGLHHLLLRRLLHHCLGGLEHRLGGVHLHLLLGRRLLHHLLLLGVGGRLERVAEHRLRRRTSPPLCSHHRGRQVGV